MFYVVIPIILIITFCAFFFSKKARIKRKLKNTTLKRISDFKDNETAKIIGHVKIINQPIIAPLSHRECAHYYIKVERNVSSGKNSHWESIIEEEIGHHFLIKDGTDYAYINDKNIKSYIVQDEKFRSGFGNDATERLEKYLDSKGEKSEGFLGFNKTIRYSEGILEDNEKIAVSGKGKWQNANKLNLPIETEKILEITATPDAPIYLTDDTDTTAQKIKEIKTVNTKDYSFNNRRRNRN